MTVVDERLSSGDQSLHGVLVVRGPAAKLSGMPHGFLYRARIRRNAYDNQCSAVVETWIADRGWSELQHVPIADLPVFNCSYVHGDRPERWHREMQDSLRSLYRLGLRILEGRRDDA